VIIFTKDLFDFFLGFYGDNIYKRHI